jgi:RHS repeat-associated protein
MEYDSHNQLSRYEITGERQVKLYMDPVGRVFRKEEYSWDDPNWDLVSATHYYYKGGSLVQEFDEMIDPVTHRPKNQIQWDYLRGVDGRVIRKRNHTIQADTDTLHVTSPVGSTMDVFSPDTTTPSTTPNGYIRTAEGEPIEIAQYGDENHIQYHGGFVEDKNMHETSPTVEKRMFYRMGVRHYSTSLGRFMQRDPITFMREPGKMQPLSCNPYIYAHNNPVQMSDISGFQPGGGGIMPNQSPSCPGCGGGPSYRSPFINNPGSGTDGNGGGSGGTGGGGSGDSEKEGRVCTRYWPEECVTDTDYPACGSIPCCQHDDDLDSMGGCCGGLPERIGPGFCAISTVDECACACCWGGGGEENAPAPMGSGGSFGSGSGGTDVFGPPRIGPGGSGGYPWEIHPRPLGSIFPWRNSAIGPNPWNSMMGNQSIASNIHGSMTPMFISAVVGGALLAVFMGGLAYFCYMEGCGFSSDYYAKATPREFCSVWDNCICAFCNAFDAYGFMGTIGGGLLAIAAIWFPVGALIGGFVLVGMVLIGGVWRGINAFYECLEKYSSLPREKWDTIG